MAHKLVIGRFTLQAASPLIVATGDSDPLFDVLLARDANGLPMIPASALAGVLRAGLGDTDANEFFGCQNRIDGRRSRLTLTDALFHWSNNMPRDGLVFDSEAVSRDEVAALGVGENPVERNHVCLNDKGVVNGSGKFTRQAVPRGCRFTFEIQEFGDGEGLRKVSALIREGLYLGGATRSGYGRMVCVAEGCEIVDLREMRERYLEISSTDLAHSPIGMNAPTPSNLHTHSWAVKGSIEGPLLIGGPAWGDEDRAPYREQFVAWEGEVGFVSSPVPVLPATAIKGPLRHRTLYHLNRVVSEDAQAKLDIAFGSLADDGRGQAGCLRFHDIVIENPLDFEMTHVGLDRFTGGSRRGVLFTDRMLWQPELEITVDRLQPLEPVVQTAFETALTDLASGSLGIGADWGDGAGVFGDGASYTGLTEEVHDATR